MIIDFHIHSKYSFDCFLEPEVIIARAKEKGIEGLAVTDHDTMAGVQEFRRLAPDLYIIAGQEISTSEGDILGLFLKREIKTCKRVQDVVKEIRDQEGLAILAHPFKWPHLVRRSDFLKQFDAIEVFNARNNIPFPRLENFLAKRYVKKLNLAYVAGSDVHGGFEIGYAQTIFDFPMHESSDEKIKEAILKKQLSVAGCEVSLRREVVSHFSRIFKTLRRK